MIARSLFVVLVLLALSHVLAVSMDTERTHARRAHHKTEMKVAKHRATVKNQLKQKVHHQLMSFLKDHTSVSSLSSSHIVAMDHAVSLMHKTFSRMKSAMKNLRSHISSRSKHGDKLGYVYADVVDSLDNAAPVCASLPYYVVTCSNCMNYVHHCLNCVYDKPKVVPTIIPEYLSSSYLPEYPSFPSYPGQQDQQEQQQQWSYSDPSEQQEGATPTLDHVRALYDSLKTGLPTLEQGLYTIQTDIQKIQSRLPGGVSSQESWPGPNDTPMTDQGTLSNIAQHSDFGANGPHLNHILTVVKSIQSSLPEYQKDLKQLQADLSRCSRYEPSLMSEPTTTDAFTS